MKIRYYEDSTIENNRKSIFLAGPTPRSNNVKSWRGEALEILERLGFDGDVFVPESNTGKFGSLLNIEYGSITDWEHARLDRADLIVFWIPRELKDMPAFTTNIEFGLYLKSGKIVYGRPDDAPKNRYLDYIYEKEYSKKPFSTLENTLKDCVTRLSQKSENIFFTSDTHFGSERTLKFSKRPYASASEMDKDLTLKWNAIVKANDVVYHLGDFGDYSNIKNLNGKVTLILGNYEEDDLKMNFGGDFDKYKKALLKLGFNDVVKKGKMINLNGEEVYMTHRPLDCKKDMFNLFGHIHEKNMCKRFGLNVGIDCSDYRPFSKEDVLFYKNAIENYYDDNVFVEKI